ncbi:MAG: sigma-70 family RNA polymerase sigma factor [Acidimicrobiia bacterium]|nr:sigma-70 family RNA polymerase sigma factor [Acidimicrobiia bacterium]
MESESVRDLMAAAADGSQTAWNAIVERYERLVWSVVRSFRLDDASALDVTQTVWLRLVEHHDRIRDPESLPSWLATTTRNEAIRTLNRMKRQTPSAFEYDVEDVATLPVDDALLSSEERVRVARAFEALSDECQQLMRLLTADPPLDYETISQMIGRPIGSIGPTRGRCIKRLRQLMDAGDGKDPNDER